MVIIDPEFAALIPPLDGDELRQLEANILQDGCRDALVTWNGLLLDGHNRYRICTAHNLPYHTTELDTLTDRNEAMLWIIDNQFGRRNLAPFTRGELELKRKPLVAARAHERRLSTLKQNAPEVQKSAPRGKTRDELANHSGLSYDTLAKIELISAHADEPTKAKLRANQVSVNRVAKEIKDTIRKETRKAAMEAAPTPVYEHCRVVCADFREVGKEIPDESVDAIITDPPYPQEYLPLYEPMAALAARVLKPNGSLVVMCGQSYLPAIIEAFTRHLSYQWTLAYMTPGAATQIYQRKVNTSWKPILWFTKGEYTGEWIQDVATSAQRDKEFHEWGQSESGTAALVEKLSKPGDLIFDPFTGGGTTGVVAAQLKRHFLGAEIDAEVAALAQARIHEAIQ